MGKIVLMQGNEACVEGAIAAGMRLYAGYPITPSTEIAELSSIRLPQVGGKFIQMEDEIASIACCIGGSVAGVKSMTATSGPGFSLKQENLGYACLYCGYNDDCDRILRSIAALGEGQAEMIRRDLEAQQAAGMESDSLPAVYALLNR